MRQSESGHAQVAEQVAAQLERWGLADLALLALDAFSPLTVLAGQALWVAQPTLSLWWDAGQVGALASLLEQPAGVACLRQGLHAARRTTSA